MPVLRAPVTAVCQLRFRPYLGATRTGRASFDRGKPPSKMVAYGTRRTQPSRQARADCPYAPAWAFEPEPEPAPRSHSRQGSHGAKNTDGHGRRPQQHRRRPNEEAERDENVWGLLVDDDEEIAAGRLVWDTEPLSHSPTSPSRLVAPPSPSRLGRDGNHTSGGARPASAPAARRRRARAAPEQGDPNDTGRVIPRAVRGGELKHLKKTTFFGRPADEIQPNPDEFLQKRTGRGSTGKPVPEKRKGGNGSRTIMKEAVPPNVARRRPRTAPRDHVKGHIEGDWAPVANQKLAHRSRIERSNKFQVKPGQIPKWLSQRKAEVARQRREEEAAAEEARERAAGRYRSAQPKPMPEEERTQLLAGLRAKRSELEQEYQRHSHRLVAHTAPRLCALKERLENEMDQLDAMIAKLSKGAVYIRSEE